MSPELSVFMPRIALAAAIALMVAAACNGEDPEKGAPEMATAAPAMESGAPDSQRNTPAAPADETVPEKIETAARELLADELDVDEGGFKLNSSGRMAWSDASLGCPQAGMAYAQVITPGYKLIFDLAGMSYAVHTNADGSHMVICRNGQ